MFQAVPHSCDRLSSVKFRRYDFYPWISLLPLLTAAAFAGPPGIVMVFWGVGAFAPPEKRPAHLAEARPARLILCGVVLILIAAYHVFWAIAAHEYYRHRDMTLDSRRPLIDVLRGK